MSLKAKILQALKTKYKPLGFGEKAFDSVATMLDATVTEEDKIDEAVDGVESVLKAFQGDADKRVTDAVKKAKTEKEDEKEKGKESVKEEAPKGEDVPSWAQGFIASQQALLEKVNRLEAGKTTDARKEALETMLKDMPESFRNMKLRDFSRMNFENDAEFDEYKTELESGLEQMKGIFSNEQGQDKTPVPALGGKVNKNGITADTQAYIDSKKAEGSATVQGKQIFSNS